MKPKHDWWGVFTDSGRLEAVESSEGLAIEAACNLSPHVGGKPPTKPVGRMIAPVRIERIAE